MHSEGRGVDSLPTKRTRRQPVAVVTGIAGDVGSAVVRALWDRGVRVIGIYRKSRTGARALLRAAHERGLTLHPEVVDLRRSAASRKRAIEIASWVEKEWGGADAFIGLAGYPARGVWREPFSKHQPGLLEDVYRVDTLSHVWFAQALAKSLSRRHGAIVLMSSNAALTGDELGIPFAMAKAANVALVKSLARILAPRVRVNGVAPGALRSSWLHELTPRQRQSTLEKRLLKRFGEPEEIAHAVVELAFGACQFQTGQVIVLDGGVVL